MNSRNPLISPRLWLSVGMGLVVALGCLLLDVGTFFGEGLLSAYQSQGFPEMEVLNPSSWASLLALVVVTFAMALALEGTAGTGRRVMLFLSGLVILAMASPVLALWALFWDPFVLLLSVFFAGMVISVKGVNRDRLEEQRLANEQNVMPLNAAVSPNQRRKAREGSE